MKQTLALLLTLLTAIFFSGCSSRTEDNTANTINRTYKLADASSRSDDGQAAENNGSIPARTAPLLYYPDSSGKYIINRELTGMSLNDQTLDVKLVEALIAQGILKQGITLNGISFDIYKDKRERTEQEMILLDFNKSFQKQVSACDADQERLLIGSIVDTFLSAYDREVAQITIAGKQLSSKNNSYSDPVSWYATCNEEPFTKRAKVDGVHLKLSLTRMYSDGGFLIDWDTDNFKYQYNHVTRTAIFQAPDAPQQGETPATLTLTGGGTLTEATALSQARQELGGDKLSTSTEQIGSNQVDATCFTHTDKNGGKSCYVFTDDDRVWLAVLSWNEEESETRAPRMKYILSTFRAIS